jgi:4-hydroxybenzoate polyprenyltransferase
MTTLTERPTSQLRVYAQLVRLPNVFTALADICLGAVAAHAGGILAGRWLPFGLLLAASACLYCGGMVWNDFFDIEQDRRERPFRPLPSGRISRRRAAIFGAVLMAGGLLFALLAGMRLGDSTVAWRPGILAGLLAAAVFLYDGWLKKTWAGPLGMGVCRFLNVLLGLTLADHLATSTAFYVALVVGLYIIGVTWFARTEARNSNRRSLVAAALVMLASLFLALPLPVRLEPGINSPLFPYLLVGLGFLVGVPARRAIAKPTPPLVQAAVKRALIGLVILDATLATALGGAEGLALLILLIPVFYLGRWLYQT